MMATNLLYRSLRKPTTLFLIVGSILLSVALAASGDCTPDLQAVQQQADPDTVVQGQTVTITVLVKNSACAPADNFGVTAYYGDQPIETKWISLDICEELWMTFDWDTTGVSPGTYSIKVCADSTDVIDEGFFEGNNCCADEATVTVNPGPVIQARKSFTDPNGGLHENNETIIFQVEIENIGNGEQPDNDGYEFVDVVPQWLTYTDGTATASSGVVSFDTDNNRIVWDGGIPAQSSVIITFAVTIDADAPNYTWVCNQGAVYWDNNGDGSNNAVALTDDPNSPGASDETCFEIDPPVPDPSPPGPPLEQGVGESGGGGSAPTLSEWGMITMLTLLSVSFARMMYRRRKLLREANL